MKKTHHSDYDEFIRKTVPHYDTILSEVAALISSFHINPFSLLDIGCGTGTFVSLLADQFPDCRYTLCDKSDEMLSSARKKLEQNQNCTFLKTDIRSFQDQEAFHFISALLVNHYLDHADIEQAFSDCFQALKPGGVFLTLQNTAPSTEAGETIALDRWSQFQMSMGKSETETVMHKARYGNDYFPRTLDQQKALLERAGFETIELFWFSCMQAGLYAIKPKSASLED